VLLEEFKKKMAQAATDYLDAGAGGDADERLERVVYGRFLDPDARKVFFEAYKDIESLWEILSPSAELRDHITSFNRLAQLYAAVRNAYADKIGFVADLAYKTRRLLEENAAQEGLGRLPKSVTFDVKTLESLRGDKGSDEATRSGALVFGGGHVVLPLLREAFVTRGWISDNAFLAGYGAAQTVSGLCSPGKHGEIMDPAISKPREALTHWQATKGH
jgi:hypothetical protein